MAETLIWALLRQTLLLALVCTLLLNLRGALRRRFGAGLAYASWSLVPLVLLVGSLPAQAPVRAVMVEWAHQLGGLEPAAPVLSPNPPSHAAIWFALWACGAAGLLLHLLNQQRRFQRSLQREGEHWVGVQGEGPALVGLWPARLLLPRDFAERFDASQQQLVLAHEQQHRARFDNHWNALATALLVLHWFNPLAWLAVRALRADQELACDAAVMAQHPGREADYARALLAAQAGAMSAALPWSRWTSSHPLIERITMLEQSAVSLARRRTGRIVLVSLALLGASGAQSLRAASEVAAPKVSLLMSIEVDQKPDATHLEKRTSTMTLIVASGETGKVVVGSDPNKPDPEHPAPDQIVAEFTPRVLDEGQIELRFDISGGLPQPLSIKPRLITADGVKARIETASPDHPTVKIDVTPSVVRPPQP